MAVWAIISEFSLLKEFTIWLHKRGFQSSPWRLLKDFMLHQRDGKWALARFDCRM